MTRMRALFIPAAIGVATLGGCASKSAHTLPPTTPPVALGMIHETAQPPAESKFVALGAGDSLGRMVFLHYAFIVRAEQADQDNAAEMFAEAGSDQLAD